MPKIIHFAQYLVNMPKIAIFCDIRILPPLTFLVFCCFSFSLDKWCHYLSTDEIFCDAKRKLCCHNRVCRRTQYLHHTFRHTFLYLSAFLDF